MALCVASYIKHIYACKLFVIEDHAISFLLRRQC